MCGWASGSRGVEGGRAHTARALATNHEGEPCHHHPVVAVVPPVLIAACVGWCSSLRRRRGCRGMRVDQPTARFTVPVESKGRHRQSVAPPHDTRPDHDGRRQQPHPPTREAGNKRRTAAHKRSSRRDRHDAPAKQTKDGGETDRRTKEGKGTTRARRLHHRTSRRRVGLRTKNTNAIVLVLRQCHLASL